MRSALVFCATLPVWFGAALADPVDVATGGDCERHAPGADDTRPLEFWHRCGDGYLSAFPDWRLTRTQPHAGARCVTSTSAVEFVVCGESGGGKVVGKVALRAAAPGTKAKLRLSWWNRLRRTDTVEEVTLSPTWTEFEITTTSDRGGPVELGVAATDGATQLWADTFRIFAEPRPDQLSETVQQGDERTTRVVPTVHPAALSLAARQSYTGAAPDTNGELALTLTVPASGTDLPAVSGGIPFPRGALFRREHAVVVNAADEPVPAQFDVLARWLADDSIKVLLVTLPTPAAGARFRLRFGSDVTVPTVSAPIKTSVTAAAVNVDTGAVTALFAATRGRLTIAGMEMPGPELLDGDGDLAAARVRDIVPEISGPLYTVVAVHGDLAANGKRRYGRFVTRYSFWRASDTVRIQHCWINDEPDRVFPIQSAWITLPVPAAQSGREMTATQILQRGQGRLCLEQVASSAGAETGEEQRHDGRFGAVAVRDFWQNHPCTVTTTAQAHRLWLWPGTVKGLLVPQGLARQWECLVNTAGAPMKTAFQTANLPLLHASPEWMCNSGVYEFLLPPDPENFPIFEARVGALATLGRFAPEQKERQNLYGVFNYGDAPGDGGWSNLESMAAHELFLHWVRTAARTHFDMARLAAEHYRDVDIHHGGGFCHTHCNNHVQSGEGWSHSWIQGVRDLYYLLGDLRALEVLQEVGERLLTKPVGWTTGRDWTRPIDNLVDIAGATGDRRYVDCAMAHVQELSRRQEPENAICGAEKNSWYEDRYNGGCAFTWYGCQAMAKLHQEIGAPEILPILKTEIDLSLDVQTKAVRSYRVLPGTSIGPDRQAFVIGAGYALGRGSTLFPALGYLSHVTGERHYLDLGMKILAHYMLNLRGGSDASATSYATVFLHYAKLAGIGATEEAAAFQRAKDTSYTQWPAGLENGGFEADYFAGWDVKKVPEQDYYYDELVRVGYFTDKKVRRSGARALRLHSDNAGRAMAVRAHCRLKPKTTWRFSGWLKADDAMNPWYSVALREYDEDRRTGVHLNAGPKDADGWREYTGEFTTLTRTVATVALGNRRGAGDAWFDDITITEIGPSWTLLTNNGAGRDWRKPAYPGLGVDLDGTYQPDEPMNGGVPDAQGPIPFAMGGLTDGVSKYDHLQKPFPSYCYFSQRPSGSITFDLGRDCTVKTVKINVLITPGTHGTKSITLHDGDAQGPVLAMVETAEPGWNTFDGLDTVTRKLTLVLTGVKGASYITTSEVEIWGEPR